MNGTLEEHTPLGRHVDQKDGPYVTLPTFNAQQCGNTACSKKYVLIGRRIKDIARLSDSRVRKPARGGPIKRMIETNCMIHLS